MDTVLALDIGASNSRLCLTEAGNGNEMRSITISTRPHHYDLARDEIVTAARGLVGDDELFAIGAGVAADIEDGVVGESGNMPGWEGKPFAADLSEALGVPCVVENDCAMAGLGEFSWYQLSLIYVGLGTGVGVSVVTTRKNLPYVRSTELSHTIIDTHSKLRCGCGGMGHLEAHVGGTNMVQRFGVDGPELQDDQWNKVYYDLAVGIRNFSTGDKGLPVILGGNIARLQEHRIPELQRQVNALVATCAPPEIILARYLESGLVGAAYAARQLLELV